MPSKNNIFTKRTLLYKEIRAGCAARKVHNSVKRAAQCLLIDFQSDLYQNYYSYTVIVEPNKALCNSVEEKYMCIR
jgi:hypothetical protein